MRRFSQSSNDLASGACAHRRRWAAALLLLAVSGCSATGKLGCGNESLHRVQTLRGGPEDIVHLPLSVDRTRLFVREVCRERCEGESARIGVIDIGPDRPSQPMRHGWKPADGQPFEPLGMSLVNSGGADGAMLYVIDAVKPPRIWKLQIERGSDTLSPSLAVDQTAVLADANDLQATRDGLYVTRFASFGFLPWQKKSWHGIVQVTPAIQPKVFARGLTGANGIVQIGADPLPLLVSDYWERRLRFFSHEALATEMPFATDKLDIYPDNLTRDGSRIYIAGQRSVVLAALNLALPFVPSPSAVYAIDIAKLGPGAQPELVWDSGWLNGRSVSVAVPVPGGLALGQIRAPDVLLVGCRLPGQP